jgi:hypothetical protein
MYHIGCALSLTVESSTPCRPSYLALPLPPVLRLEDNQIVTKEWDPFLRGTVMAPEGFTYLGKLSFICFGPTSKFFAATLAMGGQSNRTVAERKEGTRKAQRKVNTERANTGREVGIDRGMTMNARVLSWHRTRTMLFSVIVTCLW